MYSHRILGRTPSITAAAVVMFAVLLAACSGAASGPAGGLTGGQAGRAASTAGPAPVADAEAPDGAPKGGEAVVALNRPDLQIIKTGSLDLRVADIDAALAKAAATITGLGGYTSGSQRQGDDVNAKASVTYRIPAERWDDALVALRGLADKVLTESTQTVDVTGQVADLGARIGNLEASEKALREIMVRATEIKDILIVQGELTAIRGQIEQLTTEKKRLEDQAAFSTLAVSYILKADPVVEAQEGFDPGSELENASGSLVSVLQALATAGIWLAIVWLPILFGLVIVAILGLAIARRIRGMWPPAPVEPKPSQGWGG